MSKVEKILKKWALRPTEVNKDEVINILERFGFELDFKPGSHIVIRHIKLKNQSGFGGQGEFSVPVRNGRTVKGVYLRAVLTAIEIVTEGE